MSTLAHRFTVKEVAVVVRKHPVTVRNLLVSGELHGTQSGKGGRWTIREDCAAAFADGEKCAHQLGNVTSIKNRRAS